MPHRIILPIGFQRKNPGDKILFGMSRVQKSVGDLSENRFSVSFGLEIGSEIEIRNRSVADVDPEGEDLDRCLVEVANFTRQEVLEFRTSLINFEDTAVDLSSYLQRVSRNRPVRRSQRDSVANTPTGDPLIPRRHSCAGKHRGEL